MLDTEANDALTAGLRQMRQASVKLLSREATNLKDRIRDRFTAERTAFETHVVLPLNKIARRELARIWRKLAPELAAHEAEERAREAEAAAGPITVWDGTGWCSDVEVHLNALHRICHYPYVVEIDRRDRGSAPIILKFEGVHEEGLFCFRAQELADDLIPITASTVRQVYAWSWLNMCVNSKSRPMLIGPLSNLDECYAIVAYIALLPAIYHRLVEITAKAEQRLIRHRERAAWLRQGKIFSGPPLVREANALIDRLRRLRYRSELSFIEHALRRLKRRLEPRLSKIT